MLQILSLIFLFPILTVFCFPAEDRITNLPGLPNEPNFQQYSGYLDAGNGNNFFYWFIESEGNPRKDPLVLWLNGGPGCSSLLGFLMELGPYRVNMTKSTDPPKLSYNPYRWNLFANILFLESPSGVGFSYANDGNMNHTDDTTSLENFNSLISFFEKFPSFRQNDFIIVGESYGGIYIPTLGVRIFQYNRGVNSNELRINLKGFAVGNAALDFDWLDDSVPYFGYFHGILSQQRWDKLLMDCCSDKDSMKNRCRFSQSKSPTCGETFSITRDLVFGSGVNIYNINQDCIPDPKKRNTPYSLMMKTREQQMSHWNSNEDNPLANNLAYVYCLDISPPEFYLNHPEVRKAIHVANQSPYWEGCQGKPGWNYTRLYTTMKNQVTTMVDSGTKGMVYNGDLDLICNFLADDWFTQGLGYNVSTPFAFWYSQMKQVAGGITYYDNNSLFFATVKGAGHMVPTDKPSEALTLFHTFLKFVLGGKS